MRIRGDIEDKSSVRRPIDPLALQELQDRHTQQQPELLQCRCELKQQRLEAEKQLTQKKLQLKQQEAHTMRGAQWIMVLCWKPLSVHSKQLRLPS
ncbi:unnamed protein product [Sphagnum jensenii]|uniref:Uncharacterized protein n=1 Tax=Sphagnum jensenii TaxID=128206 RepID=A0ABP0WUF4_9BRYO